MTQNNDQLFSIGFESASFAVSSGPLPFLWKLISDLDAETHSNENLFWKKVPCDSDWTIIVFGTKQDHVPPKLLSSSDIMDNPFEFICSKAKPNFSINESAFSLFQGYLPNQLDQLKLEVDLKKPVIVTGHAVGGAIASLFTLWLLEKLKLGDNRPLCVTFGSPLIGDKLLQEAISQSSNWNSCFLHVASRQDPLPSSLISNDLYRPFGTYLFCSDYGSACFERPDSIVRLLKEMSPPNQGLPRHGYGQIVENLHRKAICKDSAVPNINHSNVLQASLTIQLWALGFPQLQQNIVLNNLVKEEVLEKLSKRPRVSNKTLDEMKMYMANLEWYKKESKKQKIGYYDNYKNESFPRDLDVVVFVKKLNIYWKDMIEEADKKPKKEARLFRTRWLYAGTNYRRMVEPLDIAKYYREGGKDYINQERSEHYKLLQKYLEDEKKPESISRQNVHSILTLDSCLWAHVEEALLSCKQLMAAGYGVAEKQEASGKLEEFEKYVYELLKKYAVSPEIFLDGSSYMKWWNDYIKIKGGRSNCTSPLANFMKNPANYERYEKGAFDFP